MSSTRKNTEMPLCRATTKFGRRCGNPPRGETQYCHVHKDFKQYNEECFCAEDNNKELFVLECHHIFHVECLEKMLRLQCPLCNADMNNLPKKIIKKIEENGLQYKLKQEEEERKQLIEEMSSNNMNQEIQAELLSSMIILTSMGIPGIFLPSSINVEIPDHQSINTGRLTFMLANSVLDRVQNALQRSSHDSNGPQEDDEGDEDFLFEGDNLEINRVIFIDRSRN